MYKLSDEALGAVMMALQNSLMNQSDIVPVLKEFDFMYKVWKYSDCFSLYV